AHAALAPPAVNRLLPLLAELYESEEFQIDLQDLRGAPPLFRWRVIENGRLLVCLDTNQLARFHAASISEERDREYFLKPIREAMHARIRSGRFAS
ncbi:MAG: hypothetical protein KIS61_36930, partial [Candidatus Eremiobacteraeota bacterium]|nr:hypothetical protein [Candidatus Eremiobacteraeota bacterium]